MSSPHFEDSEIGVQRINHPPRALSHQGACVGAQPMGQSPCFSSFALHEPRSPGKWFWHPLLIVSWRLAPQGWAHCPTASVLLWKKVRNHLFWDNRGLPASQCSLAFSRSHWPNSAIHYCQWLQGSGLGDRARGGGMQLWKMPEAPTIASGSLKVQEVSLMGWH